MLEQLVDGRGLSGLKLVHVSLTLVSDARTFVLPCMSFLTGVKATEPKTSIPFQSELAREYVSVPDGVSHTEQGRKGLGRIKEIRRCNGVVIGGINGYIGERFLQSVEPGPARRICWSTRSHCN